MFNKELPRTIQNAFKRQGPSLLMAATLLAAGCSGGSKPATPPALKQNANAVVQASAPFEIPVSEAETSLLQKSVARVLGFTDVGDIALTLYQDTESALFDSLAAQAATPDGSRPDPIFYHSPVFVAGEPKLLPLADGRINVTIPNRYTQQAVREIIAEKMADALAAYKIRVEKIGLIPHDASQLKVVINAFGETISDESEAQIDYEFRSIIFNIDSNRVPQLVIDEMKNASADPNRTAGQIFLDYISSMTVEFAYFVQQYGTSECKLNISENDLRNLYADQEGCPEETPQSEIEDSLSWLNSSTPDAVAWRAARPASAAESVNSKLQSVLNRGQVVTACLAGNEARKLQAKASVSCTKGGTRDEDQDGRTALSPIVRDILESSIKPQLGKKAGADVTTWDEDMMAAVIKMFGSPEKYMTTLTTIQSELKNENINETDNDLWTQRKDFVDTLVNHDVFTQDSQYSDESERDFNARSKVNATKGGSGGFNIGIPGVGGFGIGGSGPSGGGGNSSASDEFKRDYKEFHKLGREAYLNRNVKNHESLDALSNYLYSKGLNHGIEDIEGEFKIVPRIKIAVKAAVDREEIFGQIATNTDLGKIVQEKENFPVQLTDPADAELVVQIKCHNQPGISFTSSSFPITQFKWWQSQKFWDNVSARLSGSVFKGGCSFLGVRMFYQNAAPNAGDLPKNVYLTVYGLAETKDGTGATTSSTRSLPISVELRKGNTESSPVEGDIQIDAGSSQFSKVEITYN